MLEASFELIIPLVVASIIDRGISNSDKTHIYSMCALMAILGFLGFISSVTAQYFAAHTAVGFITQVRMALFEKIQSFSYTTLDKTGKSTLINRMTSDTNQLQTGVNLTLRLLLRSPFIVFGAIAMAFGISRVAGFIFGVTVFVLSIIVFGIMFVTIPKYKKVQQSLDEVTDVTSQNLEGARVIRAFCCEDEQKGKFDEKNIKLYRLQSKVARISSLLNPFTFLIINFAVIILIYKGAFEVNSGAITQGKLIALYNYMAQILVELIKLASLIITITKSTASSSRISKILMMDGEYNLAEISIDDKIHEIKFENVSFAYEGAGAEALSNISFTARQGSVVGIIGATGSGKTTLINLIPKFYVPTKGKIYINGVDINKMDKEALRRRVGVSAQNPALFSGSVADNLKLACPEACENDIYKALKKAQADDIEKDAKSLLDKHIEEGGKNLSGGQKQRISIARALLHNPDVLIMDDSSSALDNQTEAKLSAEILKGIDNMTVFIVSQRVSSIIHSDLIIVLDDGKCVGMGTHEELMSVCGVYREIYSLQSL